MMKLALVFGLLLPLAACAGTQKPNQAAIDTANKVAKADGTVTSEEAVQIEKAGRAISVMDAAHKTAMADGTVTQAETVELNKATVENAVEPRYGGCSAAGTLFGLIPCFRNM